MDLMQRNCQRTPFDFESQGWSRRMARWMRRGAFWLVLLNVAQCGSSRIAAADASTESAGTNSEPSLAVQPETQGNAIRIIANCKPSSQIKSHADQSAVPTFDEQLLAAAIYANGLPKNSSLSYTEVTPSPLPAAQQSQAQDIAQMLQAAQESIGAAVSPVANPLKVKLSISPPTPVAAEPIPTRAGDDVSAPANSQFTIRSITKSSPVLPANKVCIEPVFQLVEDAPIAAEEPRFVARANRGTEVDAFAIAARQSGIAQISESIRESQPVIAASQPKVTDRDPWVPTRKPTIAANVPVTTTSERAVLPSDPRLL